LKLKSFEVVGDQFIVGFVGISFSCFGAVPLEALDFNAMNDPYRLQLLFFCVLFL